MIHQKPLLESLASFDHMRDLQMPRKIRAEAASGFGERLAAMASALGISVDALLGVEISKRRA